MTMPQPEKNRAKNSASINTESGNSNAIHGEKRALEAHDLTGQVLPSNDSASKKIAAEYRGTLEGRNTPASFNSWVMDQINDLYK
jgi:hypothetical protein